MSSRIEHTFLGALYVLDFCEVLFNFPLELLFQESP